MPPEIEGLLTIAERKQYDTAFRFRDWDTVSHLQDIAAERRATGEDPYDYRDAMMRGLGVWLGFMAALMAVALALAWWLA